MSAAKFRGEVLAGNRKLDSAAQRGIYSTCPRGVGVARRGGAPRAKEVTPALSSKVQTSLAQAAFADLQALSSSCGPREEASSSLCLVCRAFSRPGPAMMAHAQV